MLRDRVSEPLYVQIVAPRGGLSLELGRFAAVDAPRPVYLTQATMSDESVRSPYQSNQ
jgi:hypothetical protein